MGEEFLEEDTESMVQFWDGLNNQEFEALLRNALEITIASAYASLGGIDYIISRLRESGREKRVNFLLAEDFHESEVMRRIIINRMLEIPNSEVRLYEKGSVFHPKVYIFRNGPIADVIVGSMNVTIGGFFRNIEAGLYVRDPEVEKQAISFFNKYWSKARRVVADPSLELPVKDQSFSMGADVVEVSTGRRGLIRGVGVADAGWVYDVYFSADETRPVPEKQLMLDTQKLLASTTDVVQTIVSAETDPHVVATYVLWRKLSQAASQNLFSYQSSRTYHYDYQFIPLMKLLRGSTHTILIADEVGLGKTIEACIILEELKARHPEFNRVLILCPKALTDKWQNDLKVRFDEYFEVIDKDDLFRYDAILKQGGNPVINAIMPYSQLSFTDKKDRYRFSQLALRFNLIIGDEVHTLKNLDTRRRENSRMLLQNAEYKVFLSATPVCTSSDDLLNILRVLEPKQFAALDSHEFKSRFVANNHFVEARTFIDPENSTREDVAKVKRVIDDVMSFPPYAEQYETNPSMLALRKHMDDILGSSESPSYENLAILRRLLLDLNPLSNMLTRVRRTDLPNVVIPKRRVTTRLVDLSAEEADVYREIRSSLASEGNPSSLSLMMPERYAASCIPKAASRYLGRDFNGVGDSKYEQLLDVLTAMESSDGNLPKVLIFSTFVETIDYLQECLGSHYEKTHGEGFVDHIYGETSVEERRQTLSRFGGNDIPRILLCSEIASEGLDLQFCSYLINYDLPWNPMRIEQRIGRIDRIGQRSDVVSVVNMVVRGTIDEDIYANILDGITEFNYTVGPTSDIVGNLERALVPLLFDPFLSESEREDQVRAYREAVVTAQKVQRQFDEERDALVGLDPFFIDEISLRNSNRRFFTPEECKFVLGFFLDEIQQKHGSSSHLGNGVLFLDTAALEILRQRIERLQGLSKGKRDNYLSLLRPREQGFQMLKITFEQDEAAKNTDLEFLTIHHPIIQSQLLTMHPSSSARRFLLIGKADTTRKAGTYLVSMMPVTFRRQAAGSQDTFFEMFCEVYDIPGLQKVEDRFAEVVFSDVSLGRMEQGSKDIIIGLDLTEVLERARLGMIDRLRNVEVVPGEMGTGGTSMTCVRKESDWIVGVVQYREMKR